VNDSNQSDQGFEIEESAEPKARELLRSLGLEAVVTDDEIERISRMGSENPEK
jgi:hypothetical protein